MFSTNISPLPIDSCGAPIVAADLPVDTRVGPYQLTELLASNARAALYQAEHVGLHVRVALKISRAARAQRRDLFDAYMREARTSNLIDHPNVTRVLDVRCDDGHVYSVMEPLVGETLSSILVRQTRLDIGRALDIGRQLADALAAAHRIGVVNRDLRPDSIFIARSRDGADELKLFDFGIAKILYDHEGSAGHAPANGAPAYAAPEQVLGAEVDERADLFVLGVLLHQMLTGEHPFAQARDAGELLARIAYQAPVAASVVREMPREVAGAIDALLLELMSKQPEHRPRHAQRLSAELARLGREYERARPGRWRRPPPVISSVPRLSRARWRWTALALGAAALIAAAAYVLTYAL